ncbi:MAG: hypothetical protein FWD57_12550, partial [Polyangiaceae bacterium]|nr:hypothetical protein [Polyangiaceae bacterium]
MDRQRMLQSADKSAARVCSQSANHQQTIGECKAALRENPKDSRRLLKIGDIYARDGLYAWAVDAYARAARVYIEEGFAAKAIAVYKQILELISNHQPSLIDFYLYIYPTLACLYQTLHLITEAIATYDTYALLLARSGRLREAETILRAIVEGEEDSPITRLHFAEVLLEQCRDQEAIEQFCASAEKLATMDRADNAIRVLDSAFARTKSPAVSRCAARILLERGGVGDGMQALVRLQKAYELQPRSLETLDLLARAFEVIDQKDRAIEVRKQTVRIAREQGNMDAARSVLSALLVEAPGDKDVSVIAKAIPSVAPSSERNTRLQRASASIQELTMMDAEPASTDEPILLGEADTTTDPGDVEPLSSPTSQPPPSHHMPVPIGSFAVPLPLGSHLNDSTNEPPHSRQRSADPLRGCLDLEVASTRLRAALADLATAESSVADYLTPMSPPVVDRRMPLPSAVQTGTPPIPNDILLDTVIVGHTPLCGVRGFRGDGGVA